MDNILKRPEMKRRRETVMTTEKSDVSGHHNLISRCVHNSDLPSPISAQTTSLSPSSYSCHLYITLLQLSNQSSHAAPIVLNCFQHCYHLVKGTVHRYCFTAIEIIASPPIMSLACAMIQD